MHLHHFRAAGVSVLLECPSDALPAILHWGRDLGPLGAGALADLAAELRPRSDQTVEVPIRTALVPESRTGWTGLPGLSGHHHGEHWSPAFTAVTYEVDGQRLTATATDPHARLGLTLTVELDPSGLLRARAELRNGHDLPYTLDALNLVLPVPGNPTDLLDQAGRWSKERIPQRRPLTVGTHLRENRRGRTGADAATVLFAATADLGFGRGQAWGLHVGFSGNHRHYAERTATGRTMLGGGELLLPGEVILESGQTYRTPWVYGAYGHGLDEAARRFHDHLRARPGHPPAPRPVVLNTWEAVYFDHDLDRLLDLADRAARVGVERFVLDDGWFLGRRDDGAGLGDWYVDPAVWPDGLHPLVKRVRALGMEFGLWMEPEMINPDSDLARAHPDWILRTGDRLPPPARRQQVLDLTNPAAYAHIKERLLALVAEYDLDFIKWDHNRDLVDAGSAAHAGRAAVHAQTHAVYRLLDEVRAARPGLEIEACSSGGARVDLGILQHADRVWASDCIDPVERQDILRWTAQLLPPELIGSHIGSGRSHTTGRRHDLAFRAATAFFGHYGIEWDLTSLTDAELGELAEWIALHKRHRALLHTGAVVRVDDTPEGVRAHGVVAPDASQAIYEIAMLDRPATWPPGTIRLPGLDPDTVYRISPLMPVASHGAEPAWVSGRLELPGSALAAAGLSVPPLFPDQSALLHLTAVRQDRDGFST
ncbi:alpha-galactosidase [Nonomuraea candida]|uniref:alpha-galactosidase n=1 Tax=Nonomuraea candida TaxID=359159 RepID=UPI0005B77674|nr:alpha-galactosidase [Nonomuraea candida]